MISKLIAGISAIAAICSAVFTYALWQEQRVHLLSHDIAILTQSGEDQWEELKNSMPSSRGTISGEDWGRILETDGQLAIQVSLTNSGPRDTRIIGMNVAAGDSGSRPMESLRPLNCAIIRHYSNDEAFEVGSRNANEELHSQQPRTFFVFIEDCRDKLRPEAGKSKKLILQVRAADRPNSVREMDLQVETY